LIVFQATHGRGYLELWCFLDTGDSASHQKERRERVETRATKVDFGMHYR